MQQSVIFPVLSKIKESRMIYLQIHVPALAALSQVLLGPPPHPDEPTLFLLPDAFFRFNAVYTLAPVS